MQESCDEIERRIKNKRWTCFGSTGDKIKQNHVAQMHNM
jgi:hypothetical protein